jgi:ATP-binding cassette, subfamily B, bacterial PglK
MKTLVEIWKLLDRREQLQWLALQVVAIGMALATLISVAAAAPFFSAIASPSLIHQSGLLITLRELLQVSNERSFLLALAILFVTTVVLANAINLFGSLAMNRYAYRLGNRFSGALLREYMHRGLAFNAASDTATLFNNVVWEVNRGTTGVVQAVFVLGANLATATLIIVSLAVLHPQLAMGVLVVVGSSYAAVYTLVRQRVIRNAQREIHDTASRTRIASASFAAIKEITLSGSVEFFIRQFEESCRSIAHVAVKTQSIGQAPRWILECIALGALSAVALALLAGSAGPSRLGQLAFMAFATYRLLPALQLIFQAVVKIRADQVAFTRIAADLRWAVSRKHEQTTPPADSAWCGRPREEVMLHGVSFRYLPCRTAAIRNVTLRIPAHKTVGLIGKSGSGKTTLAHLIAGLLTPSAGSIAIDGIELDDASLAGWRTAIGYVPQDVCLLDASIAENIAFGIPAANIDHRRLRHAAQRANLHHFIASLPRGYDEPLGEHGVRMSGGERQRIGIARALYRDASLLILDEATSALDAETEAGIFATLRSLRRECTIVLITHRTSALHLCDLIFEVDGGVLKQQAAPRDERAFRAGPSLRPS